MAIVSTWNPSHYDKKWAEMAADGQDPHGEVAFVQRALNRHGRDRSGVILDAGCGTGRVAVELAARGYNVHGTDVDESMLTHARSKSPALSWHLGNLADIEFPLVFHTVVMAGNVILFVDEIDRPSVVANVARYVELGGLVIAGFQLARPDGRRVTLNDWDRWTEAVGLPLIERFSTWDEDPFAEGPDGSDVSTGSDVSDVSDVSDYVVSVHRRT